MLLVTRGLACFGMQPALDPTSIQLLPLQQQVASGAFGMTGLLAPQTPHSSWVDIQNAAANAANFYQCQAAGLIGAHASLPSISSFDPSLSTNKVRGHPPHRTLVQIFLQL
ncbi:unnamed protein product [Sphagnum balticum]